MPAPIEFWFDFSSGYAYFAAQEIDGLATRHGRTVLWRPFMLGGAFKVTGALGLSRTPMKGDYARHDWARLARLKNLPLVFHPEHPITQLPATRAFYWLEREHPSRCNTFATSWRAVPSSAVTAEMKMRGFIECLSRPGSSRSIGRGP